MSSKKMLELAVLPMVLHPHPSDMPRYDARSSRLKKPVRTTTKAHRRKKRAQNRARNMNRP